MSYVEILSNLKNVKDVRELLTDEVKAAYKSETDPEERSLIYLDLRALAKVGRFTKEFDTAFASFKKGVDEKEKTIAAQVRAETQFADNAVSIETVSSVLCDLGITVCYNQLLKEVEVQGLPLCYSSENATNILPVFLRDHMKACGFEGATVLNIEGCLNCIADRNRYNPVRKYLHSGTWDGTDRLPEIYRILGVSLPRYQMYIRKWFIQCVALGLNDDDEKPVGADGALVLQGEQGLAKTSFFRIMSPFPRWFVEGAIIDMRDKDSQIKTLRGWIAELGELDSTLKKEQSSLKAFITLPEDRIRLPYARSETRSPRRTSFCGTVNPKEYLKDETGSRRFWTVPITQIDKKALFSLPRSWIDQLWYQVYQMYCENPMGFRLSDTEIKELQADNKEFEKPIPYEIEIRELLNFRLPMSQWEWWKAGDVAKQMSGGKADAGQVGKAVKKILRAEGISFDSVTRTHHGYPETLLPFLHSCGDYCETGDEEWGENDVL